jgi:hypothetical protein
MVEERSMKFFMMKHPSVIKLARVKINFIFSFLAEVFFSFFIFKNTNVHALLETTSARLILGFVSSEKSRGPQATRKLSAFFCGHYSVPRA